MYERPELLDATSFENTPSDNSICAWDYLRHDAGASEERVHQFRQAPRTMSNHGLPGQSAL
jgi:hypothetical protein